MLFYTPSPRYTWSVVNVVPGDRAVGRTNIVLDDRLVREGLRRFRCRSKRELVHLALTELLKRARRRDLLSLRGQVTWEGDLTELRRLRP
jgi:Arc/MetJ family transcription regulator